MLQLPMLSAPATSRPCPLQAAASDPNRVLLDLI